MKFLYVASGIPVPGMLGGSTHTLEVAHGLAARGHSVHVVACSKPGWHGFAPLLRPVSSFTNGFTLHQIDVPKAASLLAAPLIARLARAVQPDLVMERYYNFAGGGLLAARRLRLPTILEVNALVVDPPAVFKRRLDDAIGGPMRYWATTQCRMADRIVTPLHTTIPAEIPRKKIVELPWGAAVERFVLGGQIRDQDTSSLTSDPQLLTPTVLFLGSFRAWHGVLDFMQAAVKLLQAGRKITFVLVGDGPERAAAEALAQQWPEHFRFTGAVAYDDVPTLLSRATIGVAPFNTVPHPALRAAGFFWSPLKVYEYMAAGLPVVTTDIPPLNTIVRDTQEGLLYPEGNIAALANAIVRLIDAPDAARAMGKRAQERVTSHFSWAHHCAELERIAVELVTR